MKRILHIINGMQSGGAESYLMNHYRKLNRNEIQFDFLLRDGNTGGIYIDEIKKMGGRVYFTEPFPRRLIKNWQETKKFLEEHDEYEIVEMHANSLMYMVPLFILKRIKKNRAVKVIVHSHSTQCYSKLFILIHMFNRRIIHSCCDRCLACSDEAGKWMFGNDYYVIRNAINLEKFQKPNAPIIYKNSICILQVARFLPVKNHVFTLKIFQKFKEKNKDAVLYLIGEGELMDDIKQLAKNLNIEKDIKFIGAINDVENYMYNASCILLPSLYEGIPLTLIEAQAAGIPCVASDNVDENCNITGNVSCLPLSDINAWIAEIERVAGKKYDGIQALKMAGYDINNNVRMLEGIYLDE